MQRHYKFPLSTGCIVSRSIGFTDNVTILFTKVSSGIKNVKYTFTWFGIV